MKIIWSPLAIDRMTEIAEYIAHENQNAAQTWVESVFQKTNNLKKFPKNGRVVPETANEEIREILFGNYRIIYRYDGKQVSMLTVRHGKQILPIEEIQGK